MAANLLVRLKRPDEALKLATAGLQKNPGFPSLQRLYHKTGGQQPYPAPGVPQPAPVEPVIPETTKRPKEMAAQNRTAAMENAGGKQVPAIGVSSNPWSRFCPAVKEGTDA
jgi:hypothetical protein